MSLHSEGALCGEGLPRRQIRRRWGEEKKIVKSMQINHNFTYFILKTWVLGVSAAVIQGGSTMPGAVSVTILIEKGEFSH